MRSPDGNAYGLLTLACSGVSHGVPERTKRSLILIAALRSACERMPHRTHRNLDLFLFFAFTQPHLLHLWLVYLASTCSTFLPKASALYARKDSSCQNGQLAIRLLAFLPLRLCLIPSSVSNTKVETPSVPASLLDTTWLTSRLNRISLPAEKRRRLLVDLVPFAWSVLLTCRKRRCEALTLLEEKNLPSEVTAMWRSPRSIPMTVPITGWGSSTS